MKPHKHAKLSARRYGGEEAEFLQIHNFFDQTKASFPGQAHRLLLHNDFGILLATQIFGARFRGAAIDHVLEDVGEIPTWQSCARLMRLPARRRRLLKDFRVDPRVNFWMSHPLMHHSLGPFLIEQLFGPELRSHAEDWLLRELGYIPAVYELLDGVRAPMARPGKGMRRIKERETANAA